MICVEVKIWTQEHRALKCMLSLPFHNHASTCLSIGRNICSRLKEGRNTRLKYCFIYDFSPNYQGGSEHRMSPHSTDQLTQAWDPASHSHQSASPWKVSSSGRKPSPSSPCFSMRGCQKILSPWSLLALHHLPVASASSTPHLPTASTCYSVPGPWGAAWECWGQTAPPLVTHAGWWVESLHDSSADVTLRHVPHCLPEALNITVPQLPTTLTCSKGKLLLASLFRFPRPLGKLSRETELPSLSRVCFWDNKSLKERVRLLINLKGESEHHPLSPLFWRRQVHRPRIFVLPPAMGEVLPPRESL